MGRGVLGGGVGDEVVDRVQGATWLNARTPSLVASATAIVRVAPANAACLTAASSSENSDHPYSACTPPMDRTKQSKASASNVRRASGPTRDRSPGRDRPPTTSRSIPGRSARLTAACRLRTATVSGARSARCSATCTVVVPASSSTLEPGSTIAATAAPSRSLVVACHGSRAANPAPSSRDRVARAPPCTLRTSPWRSSASRSLRTVISETPRRWESSDTETLSEPCTNRRVRSRRLATPMAYF